MDVTCRIVGKLLGPRLRKLSRMTVKWGLSPGGELGDIIVALASTPVNTVADFSLALEQIEVGERTTITLFRGGRRRNVEMAVQDISEPAVLKPLSRGAGRPRDPFSIPGEFTRDSA